MDKNALCTGLGGGGGVANYSASVQFLLFMSVPYFFHNASYNVAHFFETLFVLCSRDPPGQTTSVHSSMVFGCRPVGGGVRGVRTSPPQTLNIDKMKLSVDKPERL